MVETLTLNNIFSWRQKMILEIGFWEFKEEEDNSYGDGKAKIW